MKHKFPAQRNGFTLVEVLLSLAIFATVLVLLLSAFTGASRGLDLLNERSGEFRRIRLAMDRIGADLAGAFSSSTYETTAFTCKTDQFSGKPAATLVFTAFALPDISGARPASDIIKVRYFPKVGADGKTIDLYREQLDLPLVENKMTTSESRLATGLAGFKVELSAGENWTTEWPGGDSGAAKGKLPKKVSFALIDSLGKEYRRTIYMPLSGQEASVLFSGKRGVKK